VAPTSTTLLAGSGCREVGPSAGAPSGSYTDAALDHFGPLEPAPSLVVNAGQPEATPLVLRADRIEGGVLVTARRPNDAVTAWSGRLPVAAVNHDGTIRWSRCLDVDHEIEAVVAAPEHRPANALMQIPFLVGDQYSHRWVQLSLATGAEQPTFAAALQSIGVEADGVARLALAGVTDRYALLVDTVPGVGSTGQDQRIVRYDLAADVAVDVAVPTEVQNPSSEPGAMRPLLSLVSSGDVIVINGPTDAGGAVLARWQDGAWSRDPATLATVIGVHPTFSFESGTVPGELRGVDALGTVHWSDPQLTSAGTEGSGFSPDGPVTVAQVCAHLAGSGCDDYELVGLDTATGEVRWSQPGLRLVAGDPADGYVLVQTSDLMSGSPGWVLLEDGTGRAVPGQSWDDPKAFSHPCCSESELNATVRAGGVVLVTEGSQLRVWYPEGAGGTPRAVALP
jgi:hypothetical protein